LCAIPATGLARLIFSRELSRDLAETAGIRTTFGSPIFASHVPRTDAPHVALLKQAGAVVIGKTNTPPSRCRPA